MIAHNYYRIYSCIMRTFFAQMLLFKSRCALCMDPFVFIQSSFHNNTKNAKSNNSQFYKAWSLNQEKVNIWLASYITSVNVHQSVHYGLTDHTIRIENMLHFLEIFNDKTISIKNFPLLLCKGSMHSFIFFFLLHKCRKIWMRKDRANILRHLESCHMAKKSSSCQVSLFIKCYDHIRSCCSEQQKKKK